MPFPFLPAVFSICFALIWMFIGGMIVRDGHLSLHHEGGSVD
jgi:hypothetical protein